MKMGYVEIVVYIYIYINKLVDTIYHKLEQVYIKISFISWNHGLSKCSTNVIIVLKLFIFAF